MQHSARPTGTSRVRATLARAERWLPRDASAARACRLFLPMVGASLSERPGGDGERVRRSLPGAWDHLSVEREAVRGLEANGLAAQVSIPAVVGQRNGSRLVDQRL